MEDLNKTQSVAEGDLNKTQVVTEPDLTQPVTEKLADGDDKDSKTVKYTEFEKANEAKKAAEEKAALLEQQLAYVNNNQPVVQQATQTARPLSAYDQAKAEYGLADEEYITEADRSKVFQRATEISNANVQQQNQIQNNQQFAQTHADYSEVVGRMIGNQFQPSPELLKIITEKPWKAAACASSQGAYEVVMEQRNIDELTQKTTIQEEHLKQTGIDTKLAPVSGAAAAGSPVSTNTTSVTPDQQREMEERVARGDFNPKKG